MVSDMAEAYLFYRSFLDSLRRLPPEMCKSILIAISEYGLDQKEPDLPEFEMSIFDLVRPQLDASERRRKTRAENGKHGGRPKKPEETEVNQEKPEETKGNLQKPTETKKRVSRLDKVTKNCEILARSCEGVPPKVAGKLTEWMRYKGEQGFSYQDQGVRSLVSQTLTQVSLHGESAVVSCIDLSMSNGWKGIIWDKIGAKPNKAHNFEQRDDDPDALALQMMREEMKQNQ